MFSGESAGGTAVTALLATSAIALLRGDRWLFRDVAFSLEPGEALRVEGANGAGKTSLLRTLAGLLSPDAGDVLWRGVPIAGQRQEYTSELAWFGHLNGCKRDLTLRENLRCERALRPHRATPVDVAIERLGLAPLTELPMRSLSAGQQRRVALARLLQSAATLWLLDEPYTNLDHDGRNLVNEMLREHLANGGTAVVATHHSDMGMPMQRLTLG